MKLQILLSAMHQTDFSMVQKANIQSDTIIINQCDRNEWERQEIDGHDIRMISTAARGIGRSRNTALLYATGDILLFADDDVVYEDGYEKIVCDAFAAHPEADVILFNLINTTPERGNTRLETTWHAVKPYNAYQYGAVRIAVRRKVLLRENIFFSLLFGGGAPYSSGEDSLFIKDCIQKGMRLYASPDIIGKVSFTKSTWFTGYTDKYFLDKGLLYRFLHPHTSVLYCLRYSWRYRGLFAHSKTPWQAFSLMYKGTKIQPELE